MKIIDGQIRKIQSVSDSNMFFFDFEFWAESDEDTYGLLCLVQLSNPTKMFITEMQPSELAIPDPVKGLDAVKNRVENETGVTDLAFPKIIRFEKTKNDPKAGFQAFLKNDKKPTPIYKSIFNENEEAAQVEKFSVNKFKELGGTIYLLGDIKMQRQQREQ